MKEKVCIYGGTFSPIHNGHLLIATYACEELKLDRMIFVPSNISYLKNNVLAASHRLKMTELAIDNHEKFALSSIEIDRGGNSYSYETIEYFKNEYPEADLFFLVGADSYLYMENWIHPELIFSKATVVVALRDESDEKSLFEKSGAYLEKFNAKTIFLKPRRFDYSSSEIRSRVNTGLNIDLFVPNSVSKYIKDNNLYIEQR